jgi:hypothetical protein
MLFSLFVNSRSLSAITNASNVTENWMPTIEKLEVGKSRTAWQEGAAVEFALGGPGAGVFSGASVACSLGIKVGAKVSYAGLMAGLKEGLSVGLDEGSVEGSIVG